MQSFASLTISDLWIERAERDLCKGLSFSVQSGDVVRILGENGAGKSSLLKVIVGALSPEEGRIAYSGEDVTLDRSILQQDALYIGHSVGVKQRLSVAENIRWYCPDVCTNVLHEALKSLELIDYMDTPVKKLSAGQTRRVALARLWLSQKTLWLLDEPFASLDVKGVELLEERIQQHALAGGMVILTSHQNLLSLASRDVMLLP
ncbi:MULTISPECIES: cytochrome c biogenesis heme-transporting ATPase CcmA [Marinomonas]|uniref:Cytochrome c biogenesis heme-transporting ATPase CcmA n=1 Tax=Marinomonas arctica TaxID=383750 RepID=A0A7H1J3A5_9GAMM|nr:MULTISPECIES: cytochrome c biogenesis heme-transporting ATPase CcmA [Marinomonas]MCS7485944.1 transcriptional regulator [Marinomonas sp. BSi20414]QNT04971.1 cytochrome c biogenesis heme-transporting ATPase CcmA [Marinomonas arctica]